MKDSDDQTLKEPSPMADATATLAPPLCARAEELATRESSVLGH